MINFLNQLFCKHKCHGVDIDPKEENHWVCFIGKDDYIPEILIGIIPETLHLDNTLEDDFTSVQFPDLKGWSIFSTYAGRYTIRICLVKKK